MGWRCENLGYLNAGGCSSTSPTELTFILRNLPVSSRLQNPPASPSLHRAGSEATKLGLYRPPDMAFCCNKYFVLEDGGVRICSTAGGTTSNASSTFRYIPSPLRFVFFLPNLQNSEPPRPFVKQHMKSPSWFSAALRASYSRYRYLASTVEGIRSCSGVNLEIGMGGARDRSPLGRLARSWKGGSQLATLR